jgi:hypothetical protein
MNSWLARHGIESLDGEVKRLARYNVTITILCLSYAWIEFRDDSCE